MSAPPFAFVTGCPSSGTTAVGQWLLSQPGARGRLQSRLTTAAHHYMGEVRRCRILDEQRHQFVIGLREMTFARYPMTTGAVSCSLVVDQEPLDPMVLPSIDSLGFGSYLDMDADVDSYLDDLVELLDARLVFCVRHPVPVVASMRARTWGHSVVGAEPRTFTVDECVWIWRSAVHAMFRFQERHPRRGLVVRHEALLEVPRIQSQQVMKFLGQPFGIGYADFVPRASTRTAHPDLCREVLDATANERSFLGYGESAP